LDLLFVKLVEFEVEILWLFGLLGVIGLLGVSFPGVSLLGVLLLTGIVILALG
jgi:hypothetical protein